MCVSLFFSGFLGFCRLFLVGFLGYVIVVIWVEDSFKFLKGPLGC